MGTPFRGAFAETLGKSLAQVLVFSVAIVVLYLAGAWFGLFNEKPMITIYSKQETQKGKEQVIAVAECKCEKEVAILGACIVNGTKDNPLLSLQNLGLTKKGERINGYHCVWNGGGPGSEATAFVGCIDKSVFEKSDDVIRLLPSSINPLK